MTERSTHSEEYSVGLRAREDLMIQACTSSMSMVGCSHQSLRSPSSDRGYLKTLMHGSSGVVFVASTKLE
ncbi:hypothetical protein CPB85DRAFT_221936 [Mucidula mucida]|nr:hypothetical protein CPB85DRAFT_221936 [Mucidula mucida]